MLTFSPPFFFFVSKLFHLRFSMLDCHWSWTNTMCRVSHGADFYLTHESDTSWPKYTIAINSFWRASRVELRSFWQRDEGQMRLTKPDKIFINKLRMKKVFFLSSRKCLGAEKEELEEKYGSHISIRSWWQKWAINYEPKKTPLLKATSKHERNLI